MTSKTSTTQIKQEEGYISEEVKHKLYELGNVLLHGMVMATGSLIVNGMAQNYRDRKQRHLIANEPNVIEFNDKAANS